MAGVYKIQSIIKPNNIYIGSAIDINNRKWIHLSQLRKNIHPNKKLQYHYNKYGENDLVFGILVTCEKEQLLRKEQCYMNIFQPHFNICKTAGSMLGFRFSNKSKKKMRDARLGKSNSRETRLKMSITRTGLYEKDCHFNNKPILQYTKENIFIKEWSSAFIVYREIHINNGHIGSCCRGERKTAGGYIWKYKNN